MMMDQKREKERAMFCGSQIYIIYSGVIGVGNNALGTKAHTPSRERLANQRHLPTYSLIFGSLNLIW